MILITLFLFFVVYQPAIKMQNEYSIIIRSRNQYWDQFRKALIIKEIRGELGQYINSGDISYIPPNYVVHLNNPYTQRAILCRPILRTRNFELDLLPWSQEHESAQLPWIIGIPMYYLLNIFRY